jgi:mycothiol synthase
MNSPAGKDQLKRDQPEEVPAAAESATTPRPAARFAAAMPMSSAFIIRVPPTRRLEAVQSLLRGDRGAAERFVRFAAEHRIRLDAMWGRLDDIGRIAMTALASPGAGRTATLFATSARHANDIAPLAELIRATLEGITRASAAARSGQLPLGAEGEPPALPIIDLVQALVDPAEFRQAEAIGRSGMVRLAELSYLERRTPRGTDRSTIEWPADIRVERWDPGNRAEMIATLERSYVGTLDCPALAGLRRGDDVLDGHMQSGTFEPTLWNLLRFVAGPYAGRTAGVCLFNSNSSPPGSAHPTGTLELVYFGLVPEARGRGMGRILLQHGLDELRSRPEGAVLLAVDDRNEPAHRLYRDAGFRARFKRIAFIRNVRDDSASSDVGAAQS